MSTALPRNATATATTIASTADTATTHPSTATAQPVDVLIVGAGFAGLYMLHKARQLGLRALIIEAAAGVGGTWYHNRYPGARVDIQSLEYSFGFDDSAVSSLKRNTSTASKVPRCPISATANCSPKSASRSPA